MVPDQWKRGLISCLLHSAKVICSTKQLFYVEVTKMRQMFLNNGYPNSYFSSTLEKFCMKNLINNSMSDSANLDVSSVSVNTSSQALDSHKKIFKSVLKIPFVGEPSYKFRSQMVSLLKSALDVDVRPVFVSFKTSNYFSLKCRTPFPYKSNVVYLYKCLHDAAVTYIGQTTRHLTTRVNEHYKKYLDKNSQIFIHIQNCETCKHSNLSVNNFVILKSCKGFLDSAIYESLFINTKKPALNKKLGFDGKVIKLNAFTV